MSVPQNNDQSINYVCNMHNTVRYIIHTYVPELVVVVLTASEATDSGGGGFKKPAKKKEEILTHVIAR